MLKPSVNFCLTGWTLELYKSQTQGRTQSIFIYINLKNAMSFLHSTLEAMQFIVCYIYTYEYFHYNKMKTVKQGVGVPVSMKKHLSITLDDLKIAKNQPLFNQLIPFAQDVSLKCCTVFILWTPCIYIIF